MSSSPPPILSFLIAQTSVSLSPVLSACCPLPGGVWSRESVSSIVLWLDKHYSQTKVWPFCFKLMQKQFDCQTCKFRNFVSLLSADVQNKLKLQTKNWKYKLGHTESENNHWGVLVVLKWEQTWRLIYSLTISVRNGQKPRLLVEGASEFRDTGWLSGWRLTEAWQPSGNLKTKKLVSHVIDLLTLKSTFHQHCDTIPRQNWLWVIWHDAVPDRFCLCILPCFHRKLFRADHLELPVHCFQNVQCPKYERHVSFAFHHWRQAHCTVLGVPKITCQKFDKHCGLSKMRESHNIIPTKTLPNMNYI